MTTADLTKALENKEGLRVMPEELLNEIIEKYAKAPEIPSISKVLLAQKTDDLRVIVSLNIRANTHFFVSTKMVAHFNTSQLADIDTSLQKGELSETVRKMLSRRKLARFRYEDVKQVIVGAYHEDADIAVDSITVSLTCPVSNPGKRVFRSRACWHWLEAPTMPQTNYRTESAFVPPSVVFSSVDSCCVNALNSASCILNKDCAIHCFSAVFFQKIIKNLTLIDLIPARPEPGQIREIGALSRRTVSHRYACKLTPS